MLFILGHFVIRTIHFHLLLIIWTKMTFNLMQYGWVNFSLGRSLLIKSLLWDDSIKILFYLRKQNWIIHFYNYSKSVNVIMVIVISCLLIKSSLWDNSIKILYYLTKQNWIIHFYNYSKSFNVIMVIFISCLLIKSLLWNDSIKIIYFLKIIFYDTSRSRLMWLWLRLSASYCNQIA